MTGRALFTALLLLAISLTGGSPTAPPAFNPSVTVATTTTLGSGGGADWWGRASIKRRPSDNALVMAYYRATGHSANDGFVHIKMSDDDGATWTAEDTDLAGNTIADIGPSDATGSQDAGEPWLYVCPNGDLLIHTWRVDYSSDNDGTYQFRSTDGGTTWTEELAPVTWPGVTNNVLVYATDDDFVYDGVLYIAAREYTTGTYTDSKIHLFKTTDNGLSWEHVSEVVTAAEAGCIEAGMEYVGNQTIVVFLRDVAHTHSYKRFSTDMGLTWGSLIDSTAEMGIAARQRVYTISHLRGRPGWWNDPRLIIVGFTQDTPGSSQDRTNVVWYSPDRGVTVYGPFDLDTTAEDGGYGDIFAKADGTFGVVSYRGSLTAASLKQYDLTIDGL